MLGYPELRWGSWTHPLSKVSPAPGSPDVVVVGFGQLLTGVPQSLQPLLLLWDAVGR